RIEGIVESRFFVEMLDGVELMKRSNNFDEKYYQGLQQWFREFLNWMENSDMGKRGRNLRNNIETVYHLQRISYATFLKDGQKVMKIVNNDLGKLIARQINTRVEQILELRRAKPTHYCIANLHYWMEIESVLKNNKLTFIFDNSTV